MTSKLSPQTSAWIDTNRVGVLAHMKLDLSDDDQIASLMARLSKRISGVALYSQLTDATAALKAPPSVQKEMNAFAKSVSAYWEILATTDEIGLLSVSKTFQTGKDSRPVVTAAISAAAAGNLNVKAATEIVLGAARFYAQRDVAGETGAKIPWYCFVCYSVPIWGLVCIFSRTCRGG